MKKEGKNESSSSRSSVCWGHTTLARKKIVENKRQFWRKESIHNCSNSNAAAKEKTPFLFYLNIANWSCGGGGGGLAGAILLKSAKQSICLSVCVYELKTV